MTASVVVGYIIFVYESYRYSAANLGNKLLAKYSVGKDPGDSLFYIVSDVKCDRVTASATMNLSDKMTRFVVSKEPYTLKVLPECSKFDMTCIAV